jgi:hypothetical protein
LSVLRTDFEVHGFEGFDFPAIGKGMSRNDELLGPIRTLL